MRTGPGRLSLRTRGLRYFASLDGQFTTSDTGDCHWPVVWPGSYETQLGITEAAPEVESREAQHFLLAFPCHGSSFGRRVQTIAAVPATTVDKDRSPGWPLVNFAPARSLSTNERVEHFARSVRCSLRSPSHPTGDPNHHHRRHRRIRHQLLLEQLAHRLSACHAFRSDRQMLLARDR